MGIVKENAGGGQAVQIRGSGLGMPAQATDPIVQVVHRDEENVGVPAPVDEGCDKE